ncbi:MAG: HEAT repeat domain-containing protein [Ignavibacteriota bacterium]
MERALTLQDLHQLLDSPHRDVRLEALRLAKLVPLSPENRSALLRFLHEGDEEENTIAALTAGRLRLQEALPALARCLRTGRLTWRPAPRPLLPRCRQKAGRHCNRSLSVRTPRR